MSKVVFPHFIYFVEDRISSVVILKAIRIKSFNYGSGFKEARYKCVHDDYEIEVSDYDIEVSDYNIENESDEDRPYFKSFDKAREEKQKRLTYHMDRMSAQISDLLNIKESLKEYLLKSCIIIKKNMMKYMCIS